MVLSNSEEFVMLACIALTMPLHNLCSSVCKLTLFLVFYTCPHLVIYVTYYLQTRAWTP